MGAVRAHGEQGLGATTGDVSWERAMTDLRAFVTSHEAVRVGAKSLSVPPELRDEFYGLVSCVQAALTEAVLGERMEQAHRVAALCEGVRRSIVDGSALRAFGLGASLEGFLADPAEALARPAFSLVLDNLQGRTTDEAMEAAARRLIEDAFAALTRSAYEGWVYYGVVAALRPRRFWRVDSPDTVEMYPVETDEVHVGYQVTSPERRMPEAVFETADGRIFAMKSEAARELDYYGVKIERRRDSSAGGNTAGLLGHRVLLLHALDSVGSVQATVDRQKARQMPCELMVEVLCPRDMETPAYVSAFVERINAVRSRRPVQVVTFGEEGQFPEGMLDDPSVAPVCRRVAGCDGDVPGAMARLLQPESIAA